MILHLKRLKCTIICLAACLGYATIAASLRAADGPQCLVFTADPAAGPSVVQGTLLNQCGRAVTGYMLAADVTFADGATAAIDGGGEDFLMGTGAQSGSGLGPIEPGEQRATHPWTLTVPSGISKTAVVTAVPRAAAVLFADSTATGDDRVIDKVFTDRRYDLRELLFWQQSLARFKDQIVGQGPLARLVDLADVPQRERAMAVPGRPTLVRKHAEIVGAQLQFMDGLIASGKTTRPDAVSALDAILSRQVDLLAGQSNRQTRSR